MSVCGKNPIRFMCLFLCLITVFAFSFAFYEGIIWPEGGKTIKKKSKLYVDCTHASDGYIMACCSKKLSQKLKLRISLGEEVLTYDLNSDGEYEVFPLQMGSGTYKITLYQNTSGKKYTQAGQVSLKVSLFREDAAFLCPNQYVNYSESSLSVLESEEICRGLTDEQQIFDTICSYMKTHFTYDYILATQVKAGALPDIEGCMTKHRGICQDLASVMVSMLRVQGIPAKLAIGYANKTYHAWVLATVKDKEVLFDPTAAINAISNVKSYTLERVY